MDELLHNIKEGNQNKFQDFYFAQHARLYHYIFKYTRSKWLAEETVQLSFVKLWERRETLSSSFSLSTQLFRIAKSILIDQLRKNTVRKTEPLQTQPQAYNITSYTNPALPEVKDELKHILKVIRKMPPVQQKVFSYSRIDDYSHKEIAEKLSISTKTVETHITRAIKHLKKTIPIFFL